MIVRELSTVYYYHESIKRFYKVRMNNKEKILSLDLNISDEHGILKFSSSFIEDSGISQEYLKELINKNKVRRVTSKDVIDIINKHIQEYVYEFVEKDY